MTHSVTLKFFDLLFFSSATLFLVSGFLRHDAPLLWLGTVLVVGTWLRLWLAMFLTAGRRS